MRIAISSLNQVWEDKTQNRLLCEKHCEVAAYNQADIIIFPEMTLTGFSVNSVRMAESIENSKTISFFKELAQRHKLHIIYGLLLRKEGGFYNRANIVSPKGEIVNNYDKIHLFKFSEEEGLFSAGDLVCTVKINNIRVGITICYDLRFPELYSAMQKCKLVINIANWPKDRILHWDSLLKARAIENQFFMLGVNRTGTDGNGLEYIKSSVCYHPDGRDVKFKIIDFDQTIDLLDLDFESLEEYRGSFNTVSSRRNNLYKIL
jgi:predicted amidohydrolase